jgi:hypothetical protein
LRPFKVPAALVAVSVSRLLVLPEFEAAFSVIDKPVAVLPAAPAELFLNVIAVALPVVSEVSVTLMTLPVVADEVTVRMFVASAAAPSPSLANCGVDEVWIPWTVSKTEDETTKLADGAAIDGTPVLEVTKTALFAVARPVMVLFPEEYRSWFAVVVAGYVAVDQAGVADEPESKT